MRSVVLTRLVCLVLPLAGACSLSHETMPHDGGTTVSDLGSALDAASDLGATPDLGGGFDAGGDTRSCTERWRSLPYCPAEPSDAIGRPCSIEGQSCGSCCLPGVPVTCTGGVWTEGPPVECPFGILCPAVPRCGTGFCAPGSVCLHAAFEIAEPDRCVVAPFPASTCGDVPDGWRSSDSTSCTLCTCTEGSSPFGVQLDVALDCPCCDSAARR